MEPFPDVLFTNSTSVAVSMLHLSHSPGVHYANRAATLLLNPYQNKVHQIPKAGSVLVVFKTKKE